MSTPFIHSFAGLDFARANVNLLPVSNLLIGVLGALVASNQPAALSNLVAQTTGISVPAAVDTNSPVEQEFQRLEDEDDAAQAEVDGWIKENDQFAAKGAGVPRSELSRRIRDRFDLVRKDYEAFIKRHPDHARVRVAYASFLEDIGQEDDELDQLLKARDLDPTLPSAWNQLGNYYGEHGPTTNAFVCYEKAIQLDPTESVYYQNFGTTVYLYRTDVKQFYHINEQQVFDKAVALYAKAMAMDPTNFPLAVDVAQTYYGIKPLRINDALVAWTNALNLARDEIDREGVYIHFARITMLSSNFAESQRFLDQVTNDMYGDMKRRVTRSLYQHEHPETLTNNPPAAPAAAQPQTNLPAPSH
jgi:tetratricopeptide (TPR) repeat protein